MRKFIWSIFILGGIAIAAFLTFAPGVADAQMNPVRDHAPYDISDRAQTLHDSLIIGDLHADTMLWNRDFLMRNDDGHVDLPRMIEGNVALQVFSAVTKSPRGLNFSSNAADAPDNITLLAMGQRWPPRTWNSLFERAVFQAEKLHDYANASENFMVLLSQDDLDTVLANRAGGGTLTGGLLGIEGAHPLEGDIDNLGRLMDQGYRVIALQHFFDNALGGSLHGQNNQGLTDFGREIIQAVQDRGLILDVAHSSPRVVRDVLEMVEMPIIISHTGIFSHCPGPRNISDDLIKGIAETGGLIGIGFWAAVTCDDSPAGVAEAILAAVDLVGVDHVALGSDYDGTVTVAFDASELAALTQALMQAGLSDDDIGKIMGGNLVRVLRARLN